MVRCGSDERGWHQPWWVSCAFRGSANADLIHEENRHTTSGKTVTMRLAMSWLYGIGCLTSLLLCNTNLVTRGSCLWRWIRMEVAENSRLTCLISLPAFPDQERMLLHWRMRTIMISLAWGDIELAYEYNAVAYWLLFPVSYYLCVFHNGVARHGSDGEKCQLRWDLSKPL